MQVDWLIQNVNLATMQDNSPSPYGKITDGLLAVKDHRIVWVGEGKQAPQFETVEVIDGNNGWLTPGLIDCHTHLIYGGNRAQEFSWRLAGQSYQEIALNGGGINSTVNATRNATRQSLLNDATHRLKQFMREGVTTIEIKSGYGLDLDTEIRLLETARELSSNHPINVLTTYLGAHAVPVEYKNRADEYIDYLCEQVLPVIAERKLADAVDVFCETIGFNLAQCEQVFSTAKELGLPVKGHVEQLSHFGGANLVAKYAGLSADHVEYLAEEDILSLKQNDVVAVLLPAAYYYLNETKCPPIDAMRKANLPMAVASDCNPGTAPMASLLFALNLSCVLFGLTPEEALVGVTRAAAKALNIENQKGQLQVGWDADLALWDIHDPNELSYAINMHTPTDIWVAGKHV